MALIKNENIRLHDVVIILVRVRYKVKMYKTLLIHLIIYQETGCTENCGKVDISAFLSWAYLVKKKSHWQETVTMAEKVL